MSITSESATHPFRIVPIPTPPRGLTTGSSISCSRCASRDLCLPAGMSEQEVESLDHINIGHRRVKQGETLYRHGDPFHFIFAVRSGTFKSSIMLADGREQVSGFHTAGELIGLDGVANGVHASTAIALEDTEICSIPYAPLIDMAEVSAAVQKAVTRLMSREIVREHSLMMLLGSMNAEERIAAFLLSTSQRMEARGYSPSEFHLRMSRADIGSYLGMKLETVSRTLSAFEHKGLLEVDKRHIRIKDCDSLRRTLGSRIQ